MTIDATCDTCFRTYQLKEKFAGRNVRCKECGEVFTVPEPGAAPAADPWESEDSLGDDLFAGSETAAPPPPRKRKKKRRKRKRAPEREESSGFSIGVMGILSIALGGLFLMMCVVGIFWRPVLNMMLAGIGLTGGVLMLVGSVGLTMAAFEEDVMVGRMFMMMPFYKLYFTITRIGEVWKHVLMNIGGAMLVTTAIVGWVVVDVMDEGGGRAGGPGARRGGGGGLLDAIAQAGARDEESEYHVRELAKAMHSHHETFERFAPRPDDEGGPPLISWQTSLLPFVNEQRLFAQIDREQEWDAPANVPANSTLVDWYLQPTISETTDDRGNALSHYALNQNLIGDDGGFRVRDFTDGVSNTMLLGEVGGGYKAWADPSNVRDLTAGLAPGPDTFGNPVGEGGYVALADGSVRWISRDTDPEALRALSTPNGAEVVPAF